MKTYSISEAKNKFRELVALAAKGEPQVITKYGKPTIVILSNSEYQRLTAKKLSLNEFLLDNPARKYDLELDLTRDKDTGRPTIDFLEE